MPVLRLDSETGLPVDESRGYDAPARVPRGPNRSAAASRPPGPPVTGESRLEAVIEGALAGTLLRPRPLTPLEVQRLSPLHINMLFDRAAGMKPGEIAEKYDMTAVYTAAVLGHPDSQAVLRALLSVTADRLTDPMERIQGYAHEMLDTKIHIARNSEDERLRNLIASDILDRAGLGKRQFVESEITHKFVMPEDTAARLIAGLEESQQVATVDYSKYLGGKASQGSEVEAGLVLGDGHPEGLVIASHDASPEATPETQALAEERAAREPLRKWA